MSFDFKSCEPAELLSLVEEAGGQRAFSKLHEVPRTTLQYQIELAKDAIERDRFKERPVPEPAARPVADGVQRFILTSAQDSTMIHEEFLGNLEAYRDWFINLGSPCEIMIAGFTYNKSLFEDHTKRDPLWPARIKPYMVWERIRFADKVDFCAEMNTRPTAENPLSGFETYTKHRWGIFPHPKVQLKSIPTMRDDPAKIIMSTGAVSRPNYVPLRAGIKAQFHHVIGAVLVEFDADGTFFCRHLIADENGDFYDLDRRVQKNKVTAGNRVEAINWGDLHVAQIDPIASMLAFGISPEDTKEPDGMRVWYSGNPSSTMLNSLKPKYQFFHDVSDFQARNHHNLKDPHVQFQLYMDHSTSVEAELLEVAGFIGLTERDWCETIVVESNHDLALKRWLKESDYRYDPQNAVFFLKCQTAMYESIQAKIKGFSIFEWVVRQLKTSLTNVRFLKTDESFKVCDIEKGMHGHEGANGARGSLAAFAKMGSKATIGHMHSCGIQDGAYCAGTMSKLFLGYNTGLSSWSHSIVITYPSGKRTIVTLNNGKWRL